MSAEDHNNNAAADTQPNEPAAEVKKEQPVSVFQKKGQLIYTVFIAVSFIIFVIATPLPFFEDSQNEYTLWGARPIHGSLTRWSNVNICNHFKNNVHVAAAFSIITIFFSFLATIIAFVHVGYGVNNKLVASFLALLVVASSLITWGIIADFYNRAYCGGESLQHFTWYAEGFALFVTGFTLSAVGLIAGLF